jgi:hypothetical protein
MSKKPTKEEKVLVMGKVPATVREVINNLAEEDDRTFSNMVARLLEESPRVRAKLEAV